MLELSEPYEARPIRFLEEWRESGWRLKVYGIAYRRPAPRPELVAAAKRVAAAQLPRPPHAGGRYGVGFLGVHDGRGANFVFVDWWADENELHHHVYASVPDRPADLRYLTPTGVIVCVWDLRVLCYERQAWMDKVLTNADGPDLEAYMGCRLSEDV